MSKPVYISSFYASVFHSSLCLELECVSGEELCVRLCMCLYFVCVRLCLCVCMCARVSALMSQFGEGSQWLLTDSIRLYVSSPS